MPNEAGSEVIKLFANLLACPG